MVRSIKRGPWLINYEVTGNKVIKLLFASKAFVPKVWTYDDKRAG